MRPPKLWRFQRGGPPGWDGLSGIFFTLFCFIGILILVPLWIWTLVDAIMMFAGGVTDGYGRKLQ
jgi:hypothetical protein